MAKRGRYSPERMAIFGAAVAKWRGIAAKPIKDCAEKIRVDATKFEAVESGEGEPFSEEQCETLGELLGCGSNILDALPNRQNKNAALATLPDKMSALRRHVKTLPAEDKARVADELMNLIVPTERILAALNKILPEVQGS